MKKKKYVKPETGHITVELEGTICSSIYEKKSVSAKGHELGKEYTFDDNGIGTDEGDHSVTWGDAEL